MSCPRRRVLQLSRENECEGLLQGRREREWERRLFKLNALAAHTAAYMYFLNHGMSLTIVWQGRLRVTVGQQGVRWLQVGAWHDRSYIAWISLLADGLTVKLSPCPCSHSSLAGRIAAYLCGHSKCNLLLAQARPRMIQHLTSLGNLSCRVWLLVDLWLCYTLSLCDTISRRVQVSWWAYNIHSLIMLQLR